ncbi:GGDEF domain-containing protein [Vibrio sinaloensis]|uniref:GGDEF domain-containing protein n=1 Tax=Photobacterium sp. (strain ATCC 43367) TaxID=379097 RepID=UPI0020596A90|nr:GGDEF domain-containing protein [Vibrio sinaloensis]UPQ89114.1 GGDEF domain-containing protein [Vibrio sinaloensis]
MELDIFNPSRQLRRAVLFWLSALLGCLSVALTLYNLVFNQLDNINLLIALFGLFSAYIAHTAFRGSTPKLTVTLYVYSLITATCLTTAILPIEFGVMIWTCLFPVVFYLLLGRRFGFLATLFGFCLQVVIITNKVSATELFHYSPLVSNFTLTFIAVWITAHVIEVKRRISESSLGQLASRDALTGVYNRHALMHNFESYRSESRKLPLSLLVLDLDYFKAVNDQHGHDVGDKVLVQAAALIDALSDEHLVYRIGGEEFCVALHNCTVERAKEKAEQIRYAIEHNNFNDSDEPISLTTSIGVYQCDHYANLESVLKEADKELYRAKQNGRNQVMVCSPSSVGVS